ncbi:flagellar export protein FliJ [Kordiimonas marina]|uniref:flagellar export protein FliJ n=1 Tax=Kordiimonas marina TaxID=2872312 RepID=UPI001FF5FD14|nr:hypothetical protein [Kordiimonas marina]MCJ9429564.1 hypothetical protein [Kordiimonas marina]
MASRLDNIIRLRKWELDEKRRVLATLQAEEDAIIARLDALEQEVAVQSQSGGQLEVSPTTLGIYLEGARVRADMLEAELEAQAEKVAEQQDIVAEAFRELKTFEIAREQEMKRIALKEAREEQAAFDELGIQAHMREDAFGLS